MKKQSSKQIFMYVALLGVLALILVYVFIFQKNVEKTEALVASNNNLETRVNSLKVYADNEQQYIADMEVMKPEIGKILDAYPAANLEEDVIMQAVITQSLVPIEYSTVSIGEDEIFKTIEEGVVTGAGVEAYQKKIDFVETKATYDNTITYTDMKKAIQTLFDSEYVIGINEISYGKGDKKPSNVEELSFIAEYELEGSFDLVFYSVDGNGKTYERPNMTPYLQGTTDFFRDLLYIEEEEAE